MIYGDGGTGKSGVLNYAAAWAHSRNWVVLKVRNCYQLSQPQEFFKKDKQLRIDPWVKHLDSRLFIDELQSSRLLYEFKKSNKDLLKQIPVNMDLYGKFNIVGVHDDEPNPVPNIYDPWRKYHFYDSDQFLMDFEIEDNVEKNRRYKTRLNVELPNPKTLWDIVNFASNDKLWSINALAECMEQLSNQDKFPFLMIVDQFNW